MEGQPEYNNAFVVLLMILPMRSVLLVFVVPTMTLLWPLYFALTVHDPQRATYWQLLGWADLNLNAFLQRVVLRPLCRVRPPWLGVEVIHEVEHRIL